MENSILLRFSSDTEALKLNVPFTKELFDGFVMLATGGASSLVRFI